MKCLYGVGLWLGLLASTPWSAPSARADVGDVVNRARLRGCRSSPVPVPLRPSTLLNQVARQVSRGASLKGALAAAGYRAMESSELHITGVPGDAQLAALLTAHYCRSLSDPAFREYGVGRRGGEAWLILAAPLSLPSSADAAAVAAEVVRRVNAARRVGQRCGARAFAPVAPLRPNASLARAAFAHASDMAGHGRFDHRGGDGSTPASRVVKAGYGPFRIVGENIAAGASTAAEVVQGWLASPPHCENIMDERFGEIGVAFAVNVDSTSAIYWTQDFATSAAAPSGRH